MNLATKFSHILPAEAASELLFRRHARRGLIDFTRYTNPVYAAADHHKRIADGLEALARGDIDRLMVFMPPRHGKSELASRRFPAWFLGHNPTKQIIAASYNSDLAADFGREVRNIVASEEYSRLFDVALAADSKAANRWHTNKGGIYVAAGVGTAITGRGADIGLIDDPVKDQEEADSELTREKVWNWYRSVFYTRLMPGAGIALIQTRWHDDDLAGRLLNDKGGDKWHIIELPAISDTGAALWPEWYPVEALERIKSVLSKRQWNALYQQNPIPDEGDFFKNDWFQWYDQIPPVLTIYGASDYAVTDDEKADFTEHGVFGVDAHDDLYILDWWYGQTTSDVWIERKLDLIRAYRPVMWAGEAGVIRRAIEPFLLKRMRERKTYCRMEWLPSIKDKPTRGRAFQARASMRKVYLPRNKEWADRLIQHLLRFPAGKYDHSVDVCTLMGRMIDKTYANTESPRSSPWSDTCIVPSTPRLSQIIGEEPETDETFVNLDM